MGAKSAVRLRATCSRHDVCARVTGPMSRRAGFPALFGTKETTDGWTAVDGPCLLAWAYPALFPHTLVSSAPSRRGSHPLSLILILILLFSSLTLLSLYFPHSLLFTPSNYPAFFFSFFFDPRPPPPPPPPHTDSHQRRSTQYLPSKFLSVTSHVAQPSTTTTILILFTSSHHSGSPNYYNSNNNKYNHLI